MKRTRRAKGHKKRPTERHVCSSAITRGMTVTLAGRVVGFQPIEARVLQVECEPLIRRRGRKLTIVGHRPMIILEDVPPEARGVGARVRFPLRLSFAFQRPGEEGMMTRVFRNGADLRAWAAELPVDGLTDERGLDDLLHSRP